MHHDTGFCNLAVRRALRNAYGYWSYMIYKGNSSRFVVFNDCTFLFECHILITLKFKVNVVLIFKLDKPD